MRSNIQFDCDEWVDAVETAKELHEDERVNKALEDWWELFQDKEYLTKPNRRAAMIAARLAYLDAKLAALYPKHTIVSKKQNRTVE